MAVYQYSKYKIRLNADTKKTQGLQTGDIIRRQYFDGKNVIYSLMCVLSYGVDTTEAGEQPYFIGALLEGDAPKTSEVLDFVRVTNLFNVDRSGALYLTASDSEAPYMDIIDQIGRKASLCWPENVEAEGFSDPSSQYIMSGKSDFTVTYTPSSQDNYRLVTIRRRTKTATEFVGLTQQFYQFVQNPQRVLISYKVRASRTLKTTARLAYVDDTKVDASWDETLSTTWEYKLRVVTVEFSGRHLRTFKLDLGDMNVNDHVFISDFNIILLSSVANFADASTMRIGKLDGIVDPVFGKLEGYGAYLQRLYATNGAHVSGTLTAGDENGFGGTFYAGKIHRNCFRSSVDIDFVGDISIVDGDVNNPTGIGNVYSTGASCTMRTQSRSWLGEHIGQRYTFSIWVYAKQVCQIGIQQNGHQVGTIQVQQDNIHKWYRIQTHFDLLTPKADKDDMLIALAISYGGSVFQNVDSSETNPDETIVYLSAPQLEKGDIATQYQATDNQLNYTDDYGAWFARGGIGGTIQNPLLKLNYDGNGSIGTRTKSFLLRTDGSGYFANQNISWDEQGKVTFGDEVTLNWQNLGQSVQQAMLSKSVKITGADTFTLLGDESSSATQFSPQAITLTMTEENLTSTSSQRKWYYLKEKDWVRFQSQNSKMLTILPDGAYWNSDSSLTIKCEVTIGANVYTDTFTIRKQYILGYTIKVSSTQGESFKNGNCTTTLQADVYYQGKLVDPSYVEENFTFVWKKYDLPDIENESQGWWEKQTDEEGNVIQEAIDRTQRIIQLGYRISGSDLFICELQNGSSVFPYTFPIIF